MIDKLGGYFTFRWNDIIVFVGRRDTIIKGTAKIHIILEKYNSRWDT